MPSLLRTQNVLDIIGNRIVFVVAGPPGTGKSTLVGQMIATGPTLLLCTLQRELDSWLYRKYNPKTVLLIDDEWKPALNQLRATAFDNFMRTCEALADDDIYDNIILDSGTELGEAGWRKALSSSNVATVAEIGGKDSRWLPFDQLDTYLDQGVRALTGLAFSSTAKRPKNVGITWHVQPAKEDTTERIGEGQNRVSVQKTSADHLAEGSEYEGTVLPMIRGRFRRRLQSLVPTFIYTDVQYQVTTQGLRPGIEPKYVLQVRPDKDRHTKLPGPLPETQYIPNNWAMFRKLIEETKAQQAAVEAGQPAQVEAAKPRLSVRKPNS